MVTISRRAAVIGGLGVAGVAAVIGLGGGRYRRAMQAYVYGYPLITMEMTRRVMTNVASANGLHAPMGQFVKARYYPDANFRDAPAPNADTLYTSAWLDLGEEPWILELPDMGDRYFLFPMIDAWTNVFQVPGTRTTGTKAQTYALTGPRWSGTLPAGVTRIAAPTDMVWILGRIYCSGEPADYDEVHKLQDACKLYPLSQHGKAYRPALGHVDPTIDMNKGAGLRAQVHSLDMHTFFTMAAELMVRNPPAAADRPMVDLLSEMGVVPGEPIDRDKFDFILMNSVPKAAVAQIFSHMRFDGGDMIRKNGWGWTLRAGTYGTNYTMRSLIAAIGLGANRPEDAIYGLSKTDAKGSDLEGGKRYSIRFPAGMAPPARGFWSVSLYGDDFYFVANPLNRFAISERQQLKRRPDGSFDILIQHDRPPADMEENWLPAPASGSFQLMWRIYWAQPTSPSVLNGTWAMPAIQREV